MPRMIATHERAPAAAPLAHDEPPPWRAVAAGPVVAAVTLVTALIVTSEAGVPLRDPGGVSLRRFLISAALVALLVGGDIAFRAGRARWTTARALAVGSALVSFYVTYFAYRNLKSVVPLLREEKFDGRLADLDRSLFAGSDPADLLHSLLGSGVSAYALSGVYELFFVFIPVALAFALVVLADLRSGLFLTTALALNWALAAASYFMLPSLGPDLRHAGRVRAPPRDRRQRAPGGPARRSGPNSCATRRRAAPRRASAPSPRCTSRSSSPRRWRRSCSGLGAL